MKTYYLTNPLQHGSEVKELQTALKKAKLYNGPVDGIFGAGTAHACQTAKYRLGYPKRAVKPSGGQTLLDYLQGTKKLPLAYKARRRARGYGLKKQATVRERIVEYAKWGAANKSVIHYAQVRPMDKLNQVKSLPWWTDCSEFVTTIYKWAGAPDPNGRGYDGQGYTGTMLSHGISIPLWQCKPGDVVIWGYSPGHHTAVLVDTSNHADPMIVSHGSEGGPLLMRLSEENWYQRGRPMTFKRYLKD